MYMIDDHDTFKVLQFSFHPSLIIAFIHCNI